MSTQLDRLDLEPTWVGRCAACLADIYVDPLLGEHRHTVHGDTVCDDCFAEFQDEMARCSAEEQWARN
jgi:superfamily II helicase